MENHQRDVDLHFVLDGNQQILYAPAKGLSVTDEYDKANDTEMLAAPKIYRTIPLQAGDFTFLFPGEAHSPRWQHDPEVTFVKTAIVKIPLAKLRHNLA